MSNFAQAGKHSEKRESFGHSLVVDPWGVVLARLDGTQTGRHSIQKLPATALTGIRCLRIKTGQDYMCLQSCGKQRQGYVVCVISSTSEDLFI